MTDELATSWQQYWRDLPPTPGAALWDSSPSINAADHLRLFEQYLMPTLPLLDIGCGNGTQTRYLGTRFHHVIGLDIAETAIAHAQEIPSSESVEFRQFDFLNPQDVDALHTELGDANIYMRGVIHQLPPDTRVIAAAAVGVLAGDSGHLFDIEPSPAASAVLQKALSSSATAVPKLRFILEHDIAPAELADGELERLFLDAGLRVIDTGLSTLQSTDCLPDGGCLHIPLQYIVGTFGLDR